MHSRKIRQYRLGILHVHRRKKKYSLIKMEVVPKLVFIIPYRDREQQKHFFKRNMSYILEDIPEADYKIFFVEQNDNRAFNRGALKNIGFIVTRQLYPDDYQNITFVFNDVDTMPYTKNFLDYDTLQGTIKHFYGFRFALGGIFSIKGLDFERINGFPNFWAWGFEDNLINKRALKYGCFVDRSNFYQISDKNIMHMSDGLIRNVNRTDFDAYMKDTNEGINSIFNLDYDIIENEFTIKVNAFYTGREENPNTKKAYDLTTGPAPFKSNSRRGAKIGMVGL